MIKEHKDVGYMICKMFDDGKPQNYLLSSVKSMCGEMLSKRHKRWKGTKVTKQKEVKLDRYLPE